MEPRAVALSGKRQQAAGPDWKPYGSRKPN